MLSRRQRGISLVEALVALVVMSFGMLAIVGLQASLRQNADVAKQRAEAVRIAQEEIERWRGFITLAGGQGDASYANLDSSAPVDVVGQNATYVLTRTVTAPAGDPIKTLVVDVAWRDRLDIAQAVRLSTAIVGISPEFAATLGIPSTGNPARSLGARRSEIPAQAIDLGGGSSGLMPQPGGSVVWIFNNATGVITFCATTAARTADLAWGNISLCSPDRYQLVSGFVRFSLVDPPDAVAPADTAKPVSVVIERTAPVVSTEACLTELAALYVSYVCAVPVSTDLLDAPVWSGSTRVLGLPATTALCRYTPDGTLAVPAISNADHPRDYVDVDGPLANQNFLVIGDTSTCPALTWPHP